MLISEEGSQVLGPSEEGEAISDYWESLSVLLKQSRDRLNVVDCRLRQLAGAATGPLLPPPMASYLRAKARIWP